ncbi:MAG: regulatory protein RecX [Tenuifilaceae bacterium]
MNTKRTGYLDEKIALVRAQRLCSRREKCISEVRKDFVRWNVDPESMEEIIKTLVRQGYIDEERYAVTFARDRVHLNRWGLRKVEYALKSKGISASNIKKAIDEVRELVSLESICDLMEKKARSVKYSNPEELKVKLIRFGLSRGFTYDEVSAAVDIIIRR